MYRLLGWEGGSAYTDPTPDNLSYASDCQSRVGCTLALALFGLLALYCAGVVLVHMMCNTRRPFRCHASAAFVVSMGVSAYEIYTSIMLFSRLKKYWKFIPRSTKAWLVFAGIGFLYEPVAEFCIFQSVVGSEVEHAKVHADAKLSAFLFGQIFFFWPAFSLVFMTGFEIQWAWTFWIIYPAGVSIVTTILAAILGVTGDLEYDSDMETNEARKYAKLHNMLQIVAIAVPLLGFEYAQTGELSLVAVCMTVSDAFDLFVIALDNWECSEGCVSAMGEKTTIPRDIELSHTQSSGSC